MDYDLGLSKIYELVINSNPCYAFLLDSNSVVQNQMVAAHVLAHCDFFKNNALFSVTPRDVVDQMAVSGERFHQYEMQYGKEAVEEFLDAVLALQEHVDPTLTARNKRSRKKVNKSEEANGLQSDPAGRYADLFALDKYLEGHNSTSEAALQNQKVLNKENWEKDLLLYLVQHSPILTDWQRDILTVLREEMLYFWPQLETKIMNEGWATFPKGARNEQKDNLRTKVVFFRLKNDAGMLNHFPAYLTFNEMPQRLFS